MQGILVILVRPLIERRTDSILVKIVFDSSTSAIRIRIQCLIVWWINNFQFLCRQLQLESDFACFLSTILKTAMMLVPSLGFFVPRLSFYPFPLQGGSVYGTDSFLRRVTACSVLILDFPIKSYLLSSPHEETWPCLGVSSWASPPFSELGSQVSNPPRGLLPGSPGGDTFFTIPDQDQNRLLNRMIHSQLFFSFFVGTENNLFYSVSRAYTRLPDSPSSVAKNLLLSSTERGGPVL